MASFNFEGSVSASKSLMNRALIVNSFFADFNIYGESNCNDVLIMKTAVSDFLNGKTEIYCGEAGTVLRFMALRVARVKGTFLLKGSEKLLSRLPSDLMQLLRQLGSEVELTDEGFLIKSIGWKVMGDALHLQSKMSSQFASAVFLNAWNYPLDLFISVPQSMASMSYFKMTVNVLSDLGMMIYSNKNEFHIPKNQRLIKKSFVCEPDISSIFSLASAGLINGTIKINNIVKNSLQPDISFLKIFDKMKINYNLKDSTLEFSSQDKFQATDVDLMECPDLFPVLAVVCALAEGESRLYGAKHLAFKESHRIDSTCDLLEKAGINFKKTQDGLLIEGNPGIEASSFTFDCKNDHRMAMAAGLFMLKGFNIDLIGRSSVEKSFPDYWEIIGK